MKFGLIFTALGATLVYAGASTESPVGKGLCFYASLSCGALALAYFLSRPQMLMKRADGRLHWLSWLLFAPYHLNNHLFLEAFRRTSRKPRWTEIVPGLWLGGRLRPADETKLAEASLASVLDVTGEFAEVPWLRRLPGYRCLPLLDTTAPTPEQLRDGVAFIARCLAQGPVYVHCAFGHSRSATFVISHLITAGQCRSVDEALAFVQSKRPRVRLSPSQLAVLRQVFPVPPSAS